MITISAIKGACPAGGCCLSLCCDVRIMTDFGHIGLNEVALGIPVPTYWAHLMARVIGEGAAQTLCLSATLASPQEALKLGLIDEVCNWIWRILGPSGASLRRAVLSTVLGSYGQG